MSLRINSVSLSHLEAQDVHLVDKLSADITIRDIEVACGLLPEETEREGLGLFDVFIFRDHVIGIWVLAGSQAYPDQGASVWAEPHTAEASLVEAVKRAIRPVVCQLMRPKTGEIIGQSD